MAPYKQKVYAESQRDVGDHRSGLPELYFLTHEQICKVKSAEDCAEYEDDQHAIEPCEETDGGEKLDISASQYPFFVNGSGEQSYYQHEDETCRSSHQ